MSSVLAKLFGSVGGDVAKSVADYFTQRQQIKSRERIRKFELREAIHQRNLELAKAGLTADMNWEMEFARQAERSWKDEYTLAVVSVPAVLAFIPGGSEYVASGFEALALTPLWYQGLLVSIFFATFGIRYWRRTQHVLQNSPDRPQPNDLGVMQEPRER